MRGVEDRTDYEMNPIVTPVKMVVNRNQHTSLLEFPDNTTCQMFMRGGITFPIPIKARGNHILGYAIMAGVDITTGHVFIFEEREYATIEHALTPDGHIEFEGLCNFFNHCWTTYGADTFFYNQPDNTFRKYMLQIMRSDMIKPKPHFISVHWDNKGQPEQVMYEHQTLTRLFRRTQPPTEDAQYTLDQQMEIYDPMMPDISPTMHALFACLTGLDNWPYRRRWEESDETLILNMHPGINP